MLKLFSHSYVDFQKITNIENANPVTAHQQNPVENKKRVAVPLIKRVALMCL